MCRCVSGTWDRANLRVRLVFFTPRSMSNTEDGSGEAGMRRACDARVSAPKVISWYGGCHLHRPIGPLELLDNV